MRTGSIYDMADVLKSLTFLAKSKSLSFREKRMLDRAQVPDRLRDLRGDARTPARTSKSASTQALERCFLAKARTAQRAGPLPRASARRSRPKAAPMPAGPARRGVGRRAVDAVARVVARPVLRAGPRTSPAWIGSPVRAVRASNGLCPPVRPSRPSSPRSACRRAPLEPGSRATSWPRSDRSRRTWSSRSTCSLVGAARSARRRGAASGRACSTHSGMAASGLAPPLAGIRYRVDGREHVPAGRAVVFCANHQSNVDPPVLYEPLHRRLHVLYKAELSQAPAARSRVPSRRLRARRARRTARRRWPSIARGAASLREGNSFLIFPEGHAQPHRASCCRSRRAGSSWRSRRRRPSCRSPSPADGPRCAKGSAIVRPVTDADAHRRAN